MILYCQNGREKSHLGGVEATRGEVSSREHICVPQQELLCTRGHALLLLHQASSSLLIHVLSDTVHIVPLLLLLYNVIMVTEQRDHHLHHSYLRPMYSDTEQAEGAGTFLDGSAGGASSRSGRSWCTWCCFHSGTWRRSRKSRPSGCRSGLI